MYLERVLIGRQVHEAAIHDQPRGNLSDLYPRWLGARELLLHGRDPYSAEVTGEIQEGYYGRRLDLSRRGDPHDKAGFAYPVYVVFFLAPTVGLPFPIVQKFFFWWLVVLTLGGTVLWLRIVRWQMPLLAQGSVLVLTLGSLGVMQGLKLQQISLFVAAVVAAAVALLIADRAVAAGALLAVATIKPQLVLLLLIWLAVWTLGDWRRRYRWAASFVVSMAILCGASEWYLADWIPRFWRAIREYQSYTGAISVLDGSIGTPWSWGCEIAALGALLVACWRERRQAAGGETFSFMVSMALATTVLLVPISAQYNHVLLIPAVLLLVKEGAWIWRRSVINRMLLATTTGLVVWPWISATALAGLSFMMPRETMERSWAIPLWTSTQIPVGVASLMLVYYYQRYDQGTFTAAVRPGSS